MNSTHFPECKFIIAGGCKEYDNQKIIMNIGKRNQNANEENEKDELIDFNNYKNLEYVG